MAPRLQRLQAQGIAWAINNYGTCTSCVPIDNAATGATYTCTTENDSLFQDGSICNTNFYIDSSRSA